MLKQLLWLVILSILVVLFMAETQKVLKLLAEGNQFLLHAISGLIPGNGLASKIIAQAIPLTLVPLLIGALIGGILFPVNNKIPSFIPALIWVVWVLTAVTVTLVS